MKNYNIPEDKTLKPLNIHLSIGIRYLLYGSSHETNGRSTIWSKITWNVMPVILAIFIALVMSLARRNYKYAIIFILLIVQFFAVFLTAPDAFFMYYLPIFQNGWAFVTFYWLHGVSRKNRGYDL